MINTYKFRKNIDIGSLDAENDKLLLRAFVEKNDISILRDIDDPKSILIGRTGSGKSALIKYLESKEDYVVRIDPESLSLRHLSNSDIINYFRKLENVKLDLFYKLLWKHVFIVELIKLYFQNNLTKSQEILEWIKGKFKDQAKKKKAIVYLERWEDKFWEDTEYRIKELETSLENRFKGEMGAEFNLSDLVKITGQSEEEIKKIENIKYEVINKAQKVVNESHVEEIKDIFLMMKEDIFNKTQKRCFIVVDDLDKEWVSNRIVYDLIKGLIETVKDFSEIPNSKIILALRSNIHKKIFRENISRGVQREKYNHLYVEMQWSTSELRELINKRLVELMRGTYTGNSPTIDDILPQANKRQPEGFEYILERTFMRPRDVIDFFNKCISYSDGKTKITREIIRLAENDYSLERLHAIEDEWLENYGSLDCLYGFLKNIKNGFKREEILSAAENYFLSVISSEKTKTLNDELQIDFVRYGKHFETEKLLNKVLLILYEVGLIGIKINPEAKLEYIYVAHAAYDIHDFEVSTKFYIHPMFHKALKIKESD